MFPPKFDIFPVFPKFLRYYVLSRSTTREPTGIPSLWQLGPALKHCTVPKYCYQDCIFQDYGWSGVGGGGSKRKFGQGIGF